MVRGGILISGVFYWGRERGVYIILDFFFSFLGSVLASSSSSFFFFVVLIDIYLDKEEEK